MVQSRSAASPARAKRTDNDRRLIRGRATRKALLSAATQVFLEKGYGATNIDHITCLAGVSHGTFYSHFKGKEDVFIHVLDELVEARRANVEGEPYRPSSLLDLHSLIKAQILGYFRLGLRFQPLMRVLREAMGESPVIRDFWQGGVGERLIHRAEQDICYSQAHGLYRSLDPRIVAESLSAIVGRYGWQLVMGEQPAERAEDIAETITRLYLHGVYLEQS